MLSSALISTGLCDDLLTDKREREEEKRGFCENILRKLVFVFTVLRKGCKVSNNVS